MNLLREEFCKETNTPMGLDDVYNYVKWLENKWQQERSYSEKQMDDAYDKGFIDAIERSYSEEDMREAFNNGAWRWRMKRADETFKEWFNEFKKK